MQLKYEKTIFFKKSSFAATNATVASPLRKARGILKTLLRKALSEKSVFIVFSDQTDLTNQFW
jgi:hypothetical protein